MKNLLLLLLIVCSFSCKKNSTEVLDPTTTIIGKWYSSTKEVIYYSKGVEVYRYTIKAGSTNIPVSGDHLDDEYYEFHPDGSMLIYSASGNGGYTLFGPYASRTYQLINSNNTLRTITKAPPNLESQRDQDITFKDKNTLVFPENLHGSFGFIVLPNTVMGADNMVISTTYTRG